MNWRDHIVADPDICHGKPCFRGTRVMISVVLDCLAEGMKTEEIVVEYPALTEEAIRSALAFSSELAQDQTFAA